MTYIPTISPITSDPSANNVEANYARCVITAAALLNANRSLGHRMASFGISFRNDLSEAVAESRRAAEAAAPPDLTREQISVDINAQALLLLTRDIAEYHNRITY